MDNTAKTCKKCGKLLTLDHFPKSVIAHDGHRNTCKDCIRVSRNKTAVIEKRGGGILTW